MKTFSVKFFEARISAGLTRDQAAAGICAPSYISLIEAGKRTPSHKLIKMFSKRFGVDLDTALLGNQDSGVQLQLLNAALALDEGRIDSAELVLESIKVSEMSFRLTVERSFLFARVASKRLDFTSALESLEFLLDDAKTKKVGVSLREEIWIEYLRCLYESGNLSLAVIRGAVLMANEFSDFSEFGRTTIQCQLAGIYLELGNQNQATRFANAALESAVLLNDPRGLARTEWQMAVVSASNGDDTLAKHWMQSAIANAKLAEMQESLPRMKIAMAGISLKSPGVVISKLEDSTRDLLQECLAAHKLIDAAFACVLLSEIRFKESDFIQSLEMANEGLKHLSQQQSGPFLELRLLRSRSEYELSKDLDEWVQAISEIESIQGHGLTEISQSWTDVAREATKVGNSEVAYMAYEKALNSAKRVTTSGFEEALVKAESLLFEKRGL